MITIFKKICLLVLVLPTIMLNAQNAQISDKSVSLSWSIDKQGMSFNKAVYPAAFSGLPVYSQTFHIGKNAGVQVSVSNAAYQPLQGITLNQNQLKLIESQPIVMNETAVDRKNGVATVTVLPFVNNNGQIQVLTSFDLNMTPTASSGMRLLGTTERVYVPNSLLSTGKWFKFGVGKAGVYRLDYNFLKNLGVSVDAINPADIRIFGHRAGMLPELAGADKEDDVREIPLKVVVASANRFQPNDYVLAYLPGPEKWTYSAPRQMFMAKKHLYSDTKNFFITTDAGIGARINTTGSVGLPATQVITTYNDYAFIEDNRVNIAQSGKQFVGDEFGGITDKSYNFNLPNLISTQSVKLNIAVVGKATTFGSNFTVSTDNGANVNSLFIPNVSESAGIQDMGTRVETQFSLSNVSPGFNINLSFDRNGDFNTKGWLDYLQINAISTLRYNGQPFYFRNMTSVGAGKVSRFEIQNMNSNVEIWDVTNPFNVQKINYDLSGSTASFTAATDSLKEFAVFETSNEVPQAFGRVNNQNLHALPQQDMLIVTRSAFLQQAEELAQFHRDEEQLRVQVVELNQIYNEFSSGTNDVTAIRDFVKMFYDRAGADVNQMPRYLLLFGDGTYDNKSLGDYFIPTYESDKTYESLETYLSDDYFGLLDDNEGANVTNTAAEIADVGIGRIPADNVTQAQLAVAKIKMYYSKAAYGDWRNQGTFVADDEDYNVHISDANSFADNYGTAIKKSSVDKIYLDAYRQQSAAGGTTYPAVNEAINRKLFTGTLFLNYVGHGGPLGLAKEGILTVDDIAQWDNPNKLPLFITATCEFAPYDKVDEFTAGERVLFKENGGGIALVTTTRVVYSNRNKTMNDNFMEQMANAYPNQQVKIGDIIREAKKFTNTFDGNRKFTLLGDPALRLAFPKYNVLATSINNIPFAAPHDTMKALSKITIEGEVRDNGNVLMPSFNGLASINIYDKVKTINTLVNDPVGVDNPDGSLPFDFLLQKNIIYRGKTKVTDGKFKFTFLVPKDIDYNYGFGKISMYASSDTTDAAGYSTDIVIGGAKDTLLADNQGPDVDVFLNDDKFAFGGITDETPRLFSRLYDENGINTSGNGVGHDITAIIDNDTRKVYNLNDFYETNVDDVSRGVVNYPFSKLSKGRHTLQVKAWDVLNNSGVGYTEFIVEEKANLALSHVLNYPNPFTTNTRFMFEHNKPGVPLDVRVEIFTVSGKVIKTISKNINTEGYRVDDISWDGLDDFGDKIGKGVYIYRISLRDESGKKISQYQKLVILN